MQTNRTHLSQFTRTMVVIVGVIIAILLTFQTGMFSASAERNANQPANELAGTVLDAEEDEDWEQRENNGFLRYSTVFQYIAENLPYMNRK